MVERLGVFLVLNANLALEQFTEFATLAAPRLRRTAFLLCGDWHTAEDLAQTALAKVFVSWRRISQKDAAQAYDLNANTNAPRTGTSTPPADTNRPANAR